MTNWVDKQSESIEWFTPRTILEPVWKYFSGPIPLDPATDGSNPTRATKFITATDNGGGLAQPWGHGGASAFINPPYGKEFPWWCRKINEEAAAGREVIALLPCGARFSTEYFQDYILDSPELRTVCFVRGRVKFLRPNGEVAKNNVYDSCIYGFNVKGYRFEECFNKLGVVWFVGRYEVE